MSPELFAEAARRHQAGRFGEAGALYRQVVAADPGHARAWCNLGAILREQGDLAEAAACYERAIALDPGHADALTGLGVARQYQGRLDEAEACFRRAIAAWPDHGAAHHHLAVLQPMTTGSPQAEAAFAALERQVRAADRLAPMPRSQLLFAMGKALEDRGDHERAFDCLRQANALRRTGVVFDIAAAERRLAAVAEAFQRPLLERLAGAGLASDRPVFIVGMPRSGTTLVEQIISAHPQVHGAGEIQDLAKLVARTRGQGDSVYPAWVPTLTGADCRILGQAYLDGLPKTAPERRRVTDKWLYTFEHLGLVHLCLPNATIIHCRRDPRDTCLSLFALDFGSGVDYAYDLAELGRYWRAYDALMAHWRAVLPPGRMLEVPYEAVVADLETWARRLIAHCGLPWDDACLKFHQSGREVRTASSVQVRRPIYTGSVGRWRPFASHLRPLLETLGPEFIPEHEETPRMGNEGFAVE